MDKEESARVERLWQAARFLPQSVRFLGTRYRALFLAFAQDQQPDGDAAAVADAMAFIDFMFRQNRVGLLAPEQRALRADSKKLRRRYRLKRQGGKFKAVEKWRMLQWLGL